MDRPATETQFSEGRQDTFQSSRLEATDKVDYPHLVEYDWNPLLEMSSPWDSTEFEWPLTVPLPSDPAVSTALPTADTSSSGEYITTPTSPVQAFQQSEPPLLALGTGDADLEYIEQWLTPEVLCGWVAAPIKDVPDNPTQPVTVPSSKAAATPELGQPTPPKKKRGRPLLNLDAEPRKLWKKQEGIHTRMDGSAPDEEKATSPTKTKRDRLRASNRAAATRHRLKHQELGEQLAAEERNARTEQTALLARIKELRGEVLELKIEVLRHSRCDCPLIQEYLSAAAQRAYYQVAKPHPEGLGDGGSVDLNMRIGFVADQGVEQSSDFGWGFGV